MNPPIERFVFSIEPDPSREIRLGVIADTHGYLHPDIREIFGGCDTIVHLGDIGAIEVLDHLKRIAPVIAIRGNHEPSSLVHLPALKLVEFGGIRTLLSHGLSSMSRDAARAVFPQLYERFKSQRIRLVLFGHTHEAQAYEEDGVVFANPGFAGPPEAGRRGSVAILHLTRRRGVWELYPLAAQAPERRPL